MRVEVFERLKVFAGLEASDAELLRALHPQIHDLFPEVVDDFYRRVAADEVTGRILREAGNLERLRESFAAWLDTVFLGPHDAEYCDRRARVGETHVRVGLPPAYVYAAMSHVRRQLHTCLVRRIGAGPGLAPALAAVGKILDLDLAVIADSYHQAEKYRDLVENAPDMIHQVDLEGRIVRVNDTEVRRLERDRDAILGTRLEDLALPEDRPLIRAHLAQTLANGSGLVEVRLRTGSGAIVPVEIHATVERDPVTRQPIRTRGYVRDLSERKRMEHKLREQASLAQVGELASMVAHEVRNPLAGIIGVLRILRESLDDPAHHELLDRVLDRIRGLDSIVDDLLVYARPQAPQEVPFQVRTLLEDTLAFFRRDPLARGVEVEIRGDDLEIEADALQFRGVLLNLLINSAQAMDGNGRVVLTVEDRGRQCVIEVADSGPGIPPEIRDKVFEPFFTTKHRGTGLGLPTARRIVEMHGGQMSFESTPGQATVFRITLPVRKSAR